MSVAELMAFLAKVPRKIPVRYVVFKAPSWGLYRDLKVRSDG